MDLPLYIEIADLTRVLRWKRQDFFATTRCLRPALGKVVDRSRTAGRGPDMVETEATLKWLSRILPAGLDRTIEDQILARSRQLV